MLTVDRLAGTARHGPGVNSRENEFVSQLILYGVSDVRLARTPRGPAPEDSTFFSSDEELRCDIQPNVIPAANVAGSACQ